MKNMRHVKIQYGFITEFYFHIQQTAEKTPVYIYIVNK